MSKAIEICYRDRARNNAIVAWDAGISKEEATDMLKKHPTWYRSTAEYNEGQAGIS